MLYEVDISSTGSDASISLPAIPGEAYIIVKVTYSYSGLLSLGTGTFDMKFNNVKVLEFDIKTEILGNVSGEAVDGGNFLYTTGANESVDINLSGETGLVGKLSVVYFKSAA